MKNIIAKIGRPKALKGLVIFGKRRLSAIRAKSKFRETEFPREVYIENTNRCNIHCVICAREKLTRKQGFMDFALFEKLVKEMSRYRETIERFHLHNYGEPLLDKELASRITLAKECGIRHTYIVTNGSLFTSEKSKEIINAGLDEIKVSFYGTDPETYNRTMVGLDFHQTLAKISDFFEARKALGRKNPRVVIQYMEAPTNKSKTGEFIRLVRPFLNETVGDSFFVTPLYNYGTGKAFLKPGDIARICTFPWRVMVILINGDVVLCAPDYNGEQVVGNVTKNTIREIWNNGAYKKVREDFRTFRYEGYPVCRTCTVTCDTIAAWND